LIVAASRFRPGLLLRVPLDDGMNTYGRILPVKPFMAFHDYRTMDDAPDLLDVARSPVLFVLATSAALKKADDWGPVGVVSLEVVETPIPDQFWQDIGNSRNLKIIDHLGNERSATVDECRGLERYSVWHASHIEDRLNDHFAGRENAMVAEDQLEMLK
jgi:hypothetical protein